MYLHFNKKSNICNIASFLGNYEDLSGLTPAQKQHYKEFQTFMDKDLEREIEKQGWKMYD